jgi:DNA ligase-1
MAVDTASEPFDDDNYIFEPLLDGCRLLVVRKGIETRLFTSDFAEVTRKLPELHNVPVSGDIVLEGLLCVRSSAAGAYERRLVKERSRLSGAKQIRSAMRHRPADFVAFDILYHNGRDLRGLPLIKRKSVLESVMKEDRSFKYMPYMEGKGKELFMSVRDQQLEGMMAKKKSSLYDSKKSHEWLKVIDEAISLHSTDLDDGVEEPVLKPAASEKVQDSAEDARDHNFTPEAS